jgi:hypothetical protein
MQYLLEYNNSHRTVIRCACALATVPRFCADLVEVGSLPAIIECLYTADDELLQYSIILIGCLLSHEETRKQLSRSPDSKKVITQVLEQCKLYLQQQQQQQQQHLLQIQQPQTPQQQMQFVLSCVKILDVLASYEEAAIEISGGSRKGINTLVSLIAASNLDPFLAEPVFSLLYKLSLFKKCAAHFSDDFMRWAISLMRNTDPGVVRWAISIIGALVEHPTHKNAFRSFSGISSLVTSLRDPALVHLRADILATISSLSMDRMYS